MADVGWRSCGAANRAGAKFCAECGSSLAVLCPSCGAPAGGGKFCSECGAALAGTAAAAAEGHATAATAAATPAPVTERRIVSLLFADLVGFTPLSESRDPEAVR